MAIASSGSVSIGSAAGSGRSINVEVGRTQNTANSSMTAVVTAAVTGSTPRGSGSVTDAQPHAFSEWYSYAHSQNFPSPTYHGRLGTTTSAYALRIFRAHVASEAEAAGGIYIFQREISGDTVFQAEQVLTIEAGVSSQAHDEARFYTSAGGSGSTFGSHINHSSPVSIITIPDVVDIGTVNLTVAPQSSYSHTTYPIAGQDVHASMAALSGFVGNSWDGESDGPLGGYGAVAASAAGGFGFPQTQQAYTNWTITLPAQTATYNGVSTSFNALTLTTFSSWSKNVATSEN